MKFLTQRDHVSCGPVAIVNASKATGVPLSRRDIPRISRAVKRKRDGTDSWRLVRFMRKTHVARYTRSREELDRWLLADGAGILSYYDESGDWHYVTIVGKAQTHTFFLSEYYLVTNYWNHTRANAEASHVPAGSYRHQWLTHRHIENLLARSHGRETGTLLLVRKRK